MRRHRERESERAGHRSQEFKCFWTVGGAMNTNARRTPPRRHLVAGCRTDSREPCPPIPVSMRCFELHAGWLSKCDDLCALTQCHEPCSLTHFQMLCAAHVANLPVRHAVIVNLPRQQGDFKRRRSPCCHRRHGKIHTLCPRMRARADARGCSTEAAVGPWRVRLTCLPMGSRIIVRAMTWIADFTTLARPSCAVTGGEACARAGGGGAGMPAGGRCHAFGRPNQSRLTREACAPCHRRHTHEPGDAREAVTCETRRMGHIASLCGPAGAQRLKACNRRRGSVSRDAVLGRHAPLLAPESSGVASHPVPAQQRIPTAGDAT